MLFGELGAYAPEDPDGDPDRDQDRCDFERKRERVSRGAENDAAEVGQPEEDQYGFEC